jgi:hypothetical protein
MNYHNNNYSTFLKPSAHIQKVLILFFTPSKESPSRDKVTLSFKVPLLLRMRGTWCPGEARESARLVDQLQAPLRLIQQARHYALIF